MLRVKVEDLIEPQGVQTGAALHIGSLCAGAGCGGERRCAADQRHTGGAGLQVAGLGGLAQVFAGAGEDHFPLLQVADGGKNAAFAVVAGMVIGGGEDIEAIVAGIVQRPGIGQRPGAAAFHSGVALVIVEGGFQIQKADIVAANQRLQFSEAGVAALRQTAGDKGITGGNEGGLGHTLSPYVIFMWCGGG